MKFNCILEEAIGKKASSKKDLKNEQFLYIFKLQILHRCMDSIRGWMADNFLQLNEEKTEVLVCAPKKFPRRVMENSGSRSTFAKPSIRNLGVTFDSALTLDIHAKSLVHS